MGFATSEYSGDTASGGSTRIMIKMPDTINATTKPSDSTWLKPTVVFERVCKKCGSPFDSLKRKAQVCLECKQEKKK